MIPITRKENYLNEIVGWGETAPEKPLTPEEFFFAAILGEAVQTPEPLSRYQIYLAKIAGRNISVPKPLTRIELFLAKACGMDIETPTPITREEIFWSNYTAIVEKELSGIPPLTFNAVAGTLKNYRIYGNTETKTRSYSGSAPLSFPIVDGGVSNYRVYGQTSRNLFDPSTNIVNGSLTSSGEFVPYDFAVVTGYIPISAGIYTFNMDNPNSCYVCAYNSGKQHIAKAGNFETWFNTPLTFSMSEDGYIRVVLRYGTDPAPIEPSDVRNIMLSVGTEALPYEPYGESVGELVTDSQSEHYGEYAIPITNNAETANIYLDEPLTKSGDNVDYVDYAEQKRHNADGTSEDVSLPVLPAQSSSNSISVDTSVQPSSVAVDVSEVVSCGDKVTDSQSVNYGKYKIPVTLTAGSTETTNIFLDAPLAKSGNNADYIDYAEQKRYNADGTESNVTLPALPTLSGTNVLTVGTAVQPSKVYVKYKGERQ